MDPSSLIFLVIIAIWAAYLLGHWVRRRDQLATARSIDRFSEAMRVLERRTPTRPVTAARPTARSYVVAPVRVPPAVPRDRVDDRGGRPAGRAFPTAAGRDRVAGRSTSGRPVRITREAARRRARLVLGLLVASAVAWALVPMTALGWWAASVVTALLAAVLVQLRRTARGSHATTAAVRASAGPRARRSPTRAVATRSRRAASRRSLVSRMPAPARRRHHQDARSVLDQLGRARQTQDATALATARATATLVTGTVLSDDDPALPQTESAHAAATGAQGAPEAEGGWQPVPVPPPTYTLKPKARPVVRRPTPDVTGSWVDEDDAAEVDATAAGPASDSARPVPNARADVRPNAAGEPPAPAFDLDEILERRIASGS